MATIVIATHPVTDYQSWKKGFEEHAPAREAGGFKTLFYGQDEKDPNLVHLAFEVPSAAAAHGFLNDPAVQAAQKAAGVSGPPVFHIVQT